ncbi:MAG: lamin tail domain-containing protein [Candidatus Methanomethyliales bacterium]|nr:lamin tail domain-containing protein [Candidatus Methanomethylicales archaeon]
MGNEKPTQIGLSLLILFLVASSIGEVKSWSNGGYSAEPSNPDYGTHDWIAQHALDWLPDKEKQYILNNLAIYLYGTELPDNNRAPDGIGDTINHHVYYRSDHTLQEDKAAVRAAEEFNRALAYLKAGDYTNAAKVAGVMSHYIVDMAVFGHVMGSGTDWGEETHHSDYEEVVNSRTSSYDSMFNAYLSYDGELSVISAYDATLRLAYNTTFGVNGDLTCVWMDRNYNWSDPIFVGRVGQSLNLAVNYLANVLHTLYVEWQQSQVQAPANVLINEVELNPAGVDTGYEWVELYNPTTNAVDLSGWRLSTTAGTPVSLNIPPGTMIEGNGYYVFTYSSQWLDNEDESVVLYDAEGREVDRTPPLSDTYNDGRTWQRYPNGRDTDSAGDWSFRSNTRGASNGGDSRAPSSISISVSTTSLTIGESVLICGSITPAVAGATVTISYSSDSSWRVLANSTTYSNGSYSYMWVPTSAGYYLFRASWSGDLSYEGATSGTVSVTVNKIPTTVSCILTPSEVTEGDMITVKGSLSPPVSGRTVTLTYTRPDGKTFTRAVTTGPNGSYSDVYQPDVNGSWTVRAFWEGDDAHQDASSPPALFYVVSTSYTPLAQSEGIPLIPVIVGVIVAVIIGGIFLYRRR